MIIDSLNPKEQELRAIDIHQLLPQQEPFVMVSSLVQIDKVRTVTELVIDADNLFVENDRLTTEGVVENIAQTCAWLAFALYFCQVSNKNQAQNPFPHGFEQGQSAIFQHWCRDRVSLGKS